MTAYLVLVGLDYPTNAAALKRHLAGEDVAAEDLKMKRAEPGDMVDDLPAHALAALLEKAYVTPAQPSKEEEVAPSL